MPPGGVQIQLFLWLRRPQLDAAHERSRRHSQQCQNYVGDIFRCDLPGRCGGARAELGIYAPWHDIAHAHVVVAVIEHHGFAETVQSIFRRIICGAACEGVAAGQTADVDNISATSGAKAWQSFMRTIEGAIQIHVYSAAPLFETEFRHTAKNSDAGVIDENVKPSEACVHALEKFPDLIRGGDIGDLSQNTAASISLHFARSPRQGFRVTSADGDLCAFGQKPLRYCPADAAARTGHDCNLS